MRYQQTVNQQFSPAIEYIADQGQRADNRQRMEVKYALSHGDAGKFRSVLESSCHRINFNKTVSRVYSLYFDDIRLSACQDNFDGVDKRRKIRIRWYDIPFPDGFAYFEIKWREKQITGKKRYKLKLFKPLNEISYADLTGMLFEIFPDSPRFYLARYSEAVVIVAYQREHFLSLDEKLRITLDYGLAFYDQTSSFFPDFSNSFQLEDLIVIESKGTQDAQATFPVILYPLKARPTRFSKYVVGCQKLHLVSNGVAYLY